jgi:NAD(P)-dependent dehydrogenase (short-subunit alcohol dehydrogenase family)
VNITLTATHRARGARRPAAPLAAWHCLYSCSAYRSAPEWPYLRAQAMLTALVTGANGVFGRHICSGLVKQGFDVVAVVRDEAKGAALTSQVGGSCSYLVADMSCGASIGTLAASFGSGRPLHALVNNAAITPTSRLESAEGIELQWSVNVLAYHRLVKAFLPQLKAAAGGGSRAVFVASFYAGGLDLADPEFKATAYSADAAYRASKQADRMLAAAWASSDQGEGVLFASCHPGVATSNVSLGLGFDIDRSEEAAVAGAQTPLFLATAPAESLENGGYYADSRLSRCEFSSDAAGCREVFQLCEAVSS